MANPIYTHTHIQGVWASYNGFGASQVGDIKGNLAKRQQNSVSIASGGSLLRETIALRPP